MCWAGLNLACPIPRTYDFTKSFPRVISQCGLQGCALPSCPGHDASMSAHLLNIWHLLPGQNLTFQGVRCWGALRCMPSCSMQHVVCPCGTAKNIPAFHMGSPHSLKIVRSSSILDPSLERDPEGMDSQDISLYRERQGCLC